LPHAVVIHIPIYIFPQKNKKDAYFVKKSKKDTTLGTEKLMKNEKKESNLKVIQLANAFKDLAIEILSLKSGFMIVT